MKTKVFERNLLSNNGHMSSKTYYQWINNSNNVLKHPNSSQKKLNLSEVNLPKCQISFCRRLNEYSNDVIKHVVKNEDLNLPFELINIICTYFGLSQIVLSSIQFLSHIKTVKMPSIWMFSCLEFDTNSKSSPQAGKC